MTSEKRISVRARLVRFGLRISCKYFRRPMSLELARRRFREMEALIPHPPRDTYTSHVDAGGVKADLITTPLSYSDRYVLYLHGGAYCLASPSTYRHFTWRIAAVAKARVLVIDYRLAPEHPFPAALDDAEMSYRWLLDSGNDPRQIVVIGDSAGGGLVLALLLKLRDKGRPLPAAAVALSPWTDLALTGASFKSNAQGELMIDPAEVPRFADYYLAGHEARDPYASPLYGDLTGLPPTLIHVGGEEILRDDSSRMADKMREAHCKVELQVWPKMPHVWHLFAPILPEARFAIADIGRFMQRNMGAVTV